MNRKHNPLLSVIALVLLFVILLFSCAGCETDATAATEEKPAARFTVEYIETDGPGVCYIITDTETGVQYLYYRNGSNAGGMTVLQTGEEGANYGH